MKIKILIKNIGLFLVLVLSIAGLLAGLVNTYFLFSEIHEDLCVAETQNECLINNKPIKECLQKAAKECR